MKTNFLDFAKDILIERHFPNFIHDNCSNNICYNYRIYNCNNFSNN